VTLMTDVYCSATGGGERGVFANIPCEPERDDDEDVAHAQSRPVASCEMMNITAESSRKRRNDSVTEGSPGRRPCRDGRPGPEKGAIVHEKKRQGVRGGWGGVGGAGGGGEAGGSAERRIGVTMAFLGSQRQEEREFRNVRVTEAPGTTEKDEPTWLIISSIARSRAVRRGTARGRRRVMQPRPVFTPRIAACDSGESELHDVVIRIGVVRTTTPEVVHDIPMITRNG
jgi:hypothetical protein